MNPLSGMWLYINLGFAVMWDLFGWILFIIDLIPGANIISLIGSFLIDATAFITDIIFCSIYYSYLTIYLGHLKFYQVSKIKEAIRLSYRNGANNSQSNPIQKALAKKTQQISKYALNSMTNYVMDFAYKKVTTSIIAGAVELVPFLGDLSPSWTIKAWLHIKAHRERAKKLKESNAEFEDTLNKWRRSISIPGLANNIRGFQRGVKPQPVAIASKR